MLNIALFFCRVLMLMSTFIKNSLVKKSKKNRMGQFFSKDDVSSNFNVKPNTPSKSNFNVKQYTIEELTCCFNEIPRVIIEIIYDYCFLKHLIYFMFPEDTKLCELTVNNSNLVKTRLKTLTHLQHETTNVKRYINNGHENKYLFLEYFDSVDNNNVNIGDELKSFKMKHFLLQYNLITQKLIEIKTDDIIFKFNYLTINPTTGQLYGTCNAQTIYKYDPILKIWLPCLSRNIAKNDWPRITKNCVYVSTQKGIYIFDHILCGEMILKTRFFNFKTQEFTDISNPPGIVLYAFNAGDVNDIDNNNDCLILIGNNVDNKNMYEYNISTDSYTTLETRVKLTSCSDSWYDADFVYYPGRLYKWRKYYSPWKKTSELYYLDAPFDQDWVKCFDSTEYTATC